MFANIKQCNANGSHVMAVVTRARFGVDSGHGDDVELVLDLSMLNTGTTLGFRGSDIKKLVIESGLADITKMAGKPCVIHHDGHYCTFVKWHKL